MGSVLVHVVGTADFYVKDNVNFMKAEHLSDL